MTKTFTNIALAAVAAGAITLPTTGALAATRTESAFLGALLGGVAGAAVSNGRTESMALGAVAGAAIGAVADSNKDRRRHQARSRYVQRDVRPYHQESRYGDYRARQYDERDAAWRQDRYGYESSYGQSYDHYDYRR